MTNTGVYNRADLYRVYESPSPKPEKALTFWWFLQGAGMAGLAVALTVTVWFVSSHRAHDAVVRSSQYKVDTCTSAAVNAFPTWTDTHAKGTVIFDVLPACQGLTQTEKTQVKERFIALVKYVALTTVTVA